MFKTSGPGLECFIQALKLCFLFFESIYKYSWYGFSLKPVLSMRWSVEALFFCFLNQSTNIHDMVFLKASSFNVSTYWENKQNIWSEGGSPGLVVMGRDSRSEGRGFESRHRILDGHFSRVFVVKIIMFVWKDRK